MTRKEDVLKLLKPKVHPCALRVANPLYSPSKSVCSPLGYPLHHWANMLQGNANATQVCEVLGLDRVVLGLGFPRPWILRCPRFEDSIFLKIQLCDCFRKTQAVLRKNGPNNNKHRYLVSSRGEEIKVDNA